MHPLDLTVLVVYLAGIVAFGAYFSKSHHTIQDYFVSGKTIPWWAIMGSIVATGVAQSSGGTLAVNRAVGRDGFAFDHLFFRFEGPVALETGSVGMEQVLSEHLRLRGMIEERAVAVDERCDGGRPAEGGCAVVVLDHGGEGAGLQAGVTLLGEGDGVRRAACDRVVAGPDQRRRGLDRAAAVEHSAVRTVHNRRQGAGRPGSPPASPAAGPARS